MPGFLISNILGNFKLNNYYNDSCVYEEIKNEKYLIKRNTLNKFLDDKVFYEDNRYILITEGVILNSKELCMKNNQPNLTELIINYLDKGNIEFFSDFRGSFSGAFYLKDKDEWIIYTNQVGDKPIFYYIDNNRFIVGSQFNYITDALRESNIGITLNEEAVYYILTYAFMGDNTTYATEIERLRPGCYIKYSCEEVSIHQYHRFDHFKYDLIEWTEDEIIEMLDKKFNAAIKLEYNKDLEYNYKHLVDLSGGLDSRMNTWVAHYNNYKNVLNITYCQSNYLDEQIAKDIASYLKNEFIIKPLDDAIFLYDIEDIVRMNYGLALYSGITGGKRLLDCIDFDKFGVEHTGQLGDVIIGTFLKSQGEMRKIRIDGNYSHRLIGKLNHKHLEYYENKEQYMLYVRGFNGALSTHLIRQNYTEVVSPFLDVDFLEFCLSIPIKYRINHYIYKKWILKKYREAANFKWEKVNSKITDPNFIILFKKIMKHCRLKINRLLGRKKQNLGETMNPFDYWYKNYPEIKEFMDEYLRSNINNCKISKELRSDMERLYEEGNTIEKTQVLTALAAIKIYFTENKEKNNEQS